MDLYRFLRDTLVKDNIFSYLPRSYKTNDTSFYDSRRSRYYYRALPLQSAGTGDCNRESE